MAGSTCTDGRRRGNVRADASKQSEAKRAAPGTAGGSVNRTRPTAALPVAPIRCLPDYRGRSCLILGPRLRGGTMTGSAAYTEPHSVREAQECHRKMPRILLPLPSGERVGVRGCTGRRASQLPLTQPSPRRGEGYPRSTDAPASITRRWPARYPHPPRSASPQDAHTHGRGDTPGPQTSRHPPPTPPRSSSSKPAGRLP
ncbi:hypothetical protein C8J47_3060 [Sphingomonas sp. PP-F2F-G114-C0414]|nr:hypothetical protein C8J47_3060 [Sphingomonas sp. PP-F2F-G114-C0414]